MRRFFSILMNAGTVRVRQGSVLTEKGVLSEPPLLLNASPMAVSGMYAYAN